MNKLNVGGYQKLIGERIKQYRVNAGVSQKELENKMVQLAKKVML